MPISDDDLPLNSGRVRETLRRRNKPYILATFIFGTILIWVAKRFAFSSAFLAPVSPLDMYQNLNRSPVLHSPPLTHNVTAHERAVVTSLYTDSYAHAVATLGHSLKEAGVNARRIVVYIPEQVSKRALCVVEAAGWETYKFDRIPPPHNGEGIHPAFIDQYTKLSIWKLDEIGIDSVIYLDADTLVRRNFDELWNIPFELSAVPDVYIGDRGFTIGFNAGVLVLHPSTETFRDMMSKLESAKYTLKDAEQSFLNLYFGAQAVRLPYVYGGNVAIKERSTEMWDGMHGDMRVVHYTLVKPFEARPKCGWWTPCTPEVVFDTNRHKEYIQEAKRKQGGMYAEEVGWWEDAYNGAMRGIDGVC